MKGAEMNKKRLWLLTVLVLAALMVGGCGPKVPEETATPEELVTEEVPTEEATAEPTPTEEKTVDDPNTPWIEMSPEEMGCKYGEGGKCRVVLSNAFIGNDWRIQMQNTALAAAKYEPFASTFDFEILNTEYSPEAQNAALDNLLIEGVDVVLLDAYGPSAHNDWIERAVDQGVVVVSFDIVSDSPLDYKVEDDFYIASKYAGIWFAKELGCQGKIVVDLGLQAVSVAEDIARGGRDGFVEACGEGALEEVGEFYGEFAEGPMEPAISSFLATEPRLDGVYTQGYCTTVVSAYEAAGRFESDDPVLFCQGYNSNFVLLSKDKMRGVITAGSPAISTWAMQMAYQLLTGEEIERHQLYVLGVYGTNTEHDIGIPYDLIEEGVNAFPDLPGGFSSVVNVTNSPPNPPIWVQITMEDLEAVGQEF